MSFSKKEIKHLADLSALTFSDEEIASFADEFEVITQFVSQIQNAETNTTIKYEKTKTIEQLRDDVAKPGFSNEEVLLNAPEKAKGAFRVPIVVE